MKVSIVYVLIAAGVLIALGGFLTYSFGKARYEEGKSFCETAQAVKGAVQNDEARKVREEIEARTQAISDSNLDDELRDLGVMRDDTDR